MGTNLKAVTGLWKQFTQFWGCEVYKGKTATYQKCIQNQLKKGFLQTTLQLHRSS